MDDKMKHWLVAYVQSNREKKILERLTTLGIESFLPLQEEMHQWSDRRKKVQRVIIPMYIFVQGTYPERLQVLQLPSINYFMVLCGENRPATIPESQMERFKFMLDYSGQTVEMCYDHLQPGEKIRVIKGQLAGLEGEVIAMGGGSKIAIQIAYLRHRIGGNTQGVGGESGLIEGRVNEYSMECNPFPFDVFLMCVHAQEEK